MITLPDPLVVSLIMLAIGLAFELLAILSKPGNWRTVCGGISGITSMFGAAALAVHMPSAAGFLAVIVTFYRMINVLRLVECRRGEQELQSVVRRSSLILLASQLVLYGGWWLVHEKWNIAGLGTALLIVMAVSALTSLATLVIIVRQLLAMTPNPANAKSAGQRTAKLPAISLLIPARNETAEVTECIQAAIKSDYQKLEVIVLDDCSQDKTPQAIKAFAHDGVRFIQGKEPKDSWLAKNQAYDRLVSESNGSVYGFIGADVRLDGHALSSIIDLMHKSGADMVSVMPRRTGHSWLGVLIQPMRYWLELAIPDKIKSHPPVLSTCWFITAAAYKQLGGFKALSRNILPEAVFARRLAETNNYKMLRTSASLKIYTVKPTKDQIGTAIRARYPTVHRRPESVMLVSLLELLVLVAPFAALLPGLIWLNADWWTVMAAVAAILFTAGHLFITFATNNRTWPLAIISFPSVVLSEIILQNISMFKYEFSEVNWKGRNICLPIMQVFPSLPPLSAKPAAKKLKSTG